MPRIDPDTIELQEKVVQLKPVAKTVKGGRRRRFSALVVVGDGQGHVGAGIGKAAGVPDAIRKGAQRAKRNLIQVPLVGTTVPHEVVGVVSASRVLLKPASEGTGVIAGGPVRAVLEAVGVKNILTKIIGSANATNCVGATLDGLRKLKRAHQVAAMRGKSVRELPIPKIIKEGLITDGGETADYFEAERDRVPGEPEAHVEGPGTAEA